MTAVVAMLRGVNVGGRNPVKMEALRNLCTTLHLANPRTHIQSGNLIFGASPAHLSTLAARLEGAIAETLHVKSRVILRSVSDLQGVVARNPFSARQDVAPDKLVVTFLHEKPPPESRDRIAGLQGGPDEFVLHGRELYAFFPQGISGSQVSPAKIDRALQTVGTARNWNTVLKLLGLAEAWTP